MSMEATPGSESTKSEAECDPDPTPTPSRTPAPTPPPPPTPHPSPTCDPLPDGKTPPKLPDPQPCPIECDCPTTTPFSGSNCLDALIAEQASEVAKAEHAKAFKAELEALLKSANAAKQAYSRQSYLDFRARWDALDQGIVAAIDFVTCDLKCWSCVIECEVCSLVYAIRDLETQLNGDGELMGDVHSLPDLQYWHQCNHAAKAAQFERFKAVLAAWNTPPATIDAALSANEALVKSIRSLDPASALLQVFLKLIPLHLAIAPRDVSTRIKRKYIVICGCDEGTPDDCCGPDAGVMSVRFHYLVGPQPYIVDPDDFFDIICCLVQQRYLPAKDQLAKATADLAAITDRIASLKAELERRRNDLLADAQRNIVLPVDCSKYTRKDGADGGDCGWEPDPEPQPDPGQSAA